MVAYKAQNNLLPMVSIGIPTYNRDKTLRQSIESVLNQEYENIEIIISDNASADETQSICSGFCEKNEQIRYIRQTNNVGPSRNFIEVLKHARGEFFMWLADDDWIDECYIAECVKILINDSDVSLVAGITKYYCDNVYAYDGECINLEQGERIRRVLSYYYKVMGNGVFYGVMRKKYLDEVVFIKTMGGDWLIIASMAFVGKIITIPNVVIHRRLGGATASFEKLGATSSLPRFEIRYPYLSIALNAYKDISWRSPLYKSMNSLRRKLFAFCVFCTIIKYHIIYRRGRKILSRVLRLALQLKRKAGKSHSCPSERK